LDNVVSVQHLVKRFEKVIAVSGVSFEVAQGEVFGILGPNGAGKTTALECIEGIQKPTSGQALLFAVDTQKEPEKVKERIGVQLQASAYFDYLTLAEVLELFGRLYPRRVRPEALLGRVGLLEKAQATVNKLSGGQKQRFSIAATLINDPELVFLDEPTTGLDPQARRSLWEFIQSIHGEGRTVILTTHYMEEAQALCQRVAIMDMGNIVALDSPANLIRQLPTPYQVKLSAGTALALEELLMLEGVTAVQQDGDGFYLVATKDAQKTVPDLLSWSTQRQLRLQHLEVIPSTLEDVFLALTGKRLRD
jgi:ABC-2 type transport system ATP-binding protein